MSTLIYTYLRDRINKQKAEVTAGKDGAPYDIRITLDAFNNILENKEEIFQGYEAIIQALTDTSKLEKEIAKLQCEFEVVNELLQKCVEENAQRALEQAEHEECYKVIQG